MRRTPLLGAAFSLCLVVVAGCSGGGKDDKSEADVKKDLSAELQSNGDGFSKDTADCFAQLLIDEIGAKKLQDVDLSAKKPPAEIKDEIAVAAVKASTECDFTSPG